EARELRRSFGVAEDHAPPPLPEDVRLALYRLVQESVNNAVHHGGVAEVAVRLWAPRPDQLAVSVVDRGHGFARPRHAGLGRACGSPFTSTCTAPALLTRICRRSFAVKVRLLPGPTVSANTCRPSDHTCT